MKTIDLDQVKHLLNQGKTKKEIAKKIGVKENTLLHYLRKTGFNNEFAYGEMQKLKKGINYSKNINWKVYNEGLVKRGECLLEYEFLKQWEQELKFMNNNKEGKPYKYPDNFMLFLLNIKAMFKIDYRTLEGVTRRLAALFSCVIDIPLTAPNFRTIQTRFASMGIEFKTASYGEQDVSMDSSGYSQSNGANYRLIRYGRLTRGFIKLHLSVNTTTHEIKACMTTKDNISDGQMFPELYKQSRQSGTINTSFADAAYDDKDNYALAHSNGTKAVIRPNPRVKKVKLRPLKARIKKLKQQLTNDLSDKTALGTLVRLENLLSYIRDKQLWRTSNHYGHRQSSECVFSSHKRLFSGHLFSRNTTTIHNEMILKAILFNRYKLINPRIIYLQKTFTPTHLIN